MKKAILATLLAAPLAVTAQNPVIRNLFTADPTARVFNNKVYVYPSHDIVPPEGQRQDWFCMEDYHVFSSENLTDWTDHGVIVRQQDVPWGNPEGYSMWAPDCVCKNGKYYFYFPNAPKNGRGFAVGVATADSPTGPFRLEQESIKGISGIDPCVLVDNDGQAYIYWSGMGIRGARLKSNMKEVEGPFSEMKMPQRSGANARQQMPPMQVAGQTMEGLPDGFKEGPFAFRRGDWYYLTFPWVRGSKENGANPTETLAYAMSKSPLGPWDFKGIIMAEHPNGCWTNHHSLVEYQGQWYLFYHTNFFSPKDDKRRSVCIEKVSFNADGTIREVKETLRGVGVNLATERIEVDRFSSAAVGVTTEYVDTARYLNGACVNLPRKGSWVKYDQVDFSSIHDGYLLMNVKAADNTELCVRAGSEKGKVIARIKLTVRPEQPAQNSPMARFRRDQRNQWLTQTASMVYVPKGVDNLVITNEGDGALAVDWIQFKNRPTYFSMVPKGAAPARPDEQGFIRRWSLMEPMAVDVRSNIIFTNTWLRKKFADELDRLPKQKKAKWYTLDSENYNIKLFRFAEKYGKQTYGSFFWCETVIECPQELRDIRLAAGSNGASMWWIDNEEVLLLEGDRRMVEDDGTSARLTLSPGRHVLRCAVINGPGLSDLCARFLNDKGNPVTNYSIIAK